VYVYMYVCVCVCVCVCIHACKPLPNHTATNFVFDLLFIILYIVQKPFINLQSFELQILSGFRFFESFEPFRT